MNGRPRRVVTHACCLSDPTRKLSYFSALCNFSDFGVLCTFSNIAAAAAAAMARSSQLHSPLSGLAVQYDIAMGIRPTQHSTNLRPSTPLLQGNRTPRWVGSLWLSASVGPTHTCPPPPGSSLHPCPPPLIKLRVSSQLIFDHINS